MTAQFVIMKFFRVQYVAIRIFIFLRSDFVEDVWGASLGKISPRISAFKGLRFGTIRPSASHSGFVFNLEFLINLRKFDHVRSMGKVCTIFIDRLRFCSKFTLINWKYVLLSLGWNINFHDIAIQSLGAHITGPGRLSVNSCQTWMLNISITCSSVNYVWSSMSSLWWKCPQLVDFRKLWVDLGEGIVMQMFLQGLELIQKLGVRILNLMVIGFKRK